MHVPKCAGTSVEKYFMEIRDLDFRNRAALGIFLNGFDSDLERANSHSSLADIEKYYFGGPVPDDFRIFTVIRNPYKRFWSEWSFRKIPNPKRYPISFHLPLSTMIRLTKNPVARLKDFNSHMRPQWTYLEGASADRVRVLRFENLGADFDALKADWGLPDNPLPRENIGARKRSQTPQIKAQGDAFVREFYAADFEKFGYDIEAGGA